MRIKGVLITNPSTPLCTTASEINMLLRFVLAKGIHLVSNEIYSGTVFDTPGFVSIAEALIEMKIMKIFKIKFADGLPRFLVGAIYSYKDVVRRKKNVELWTGFFPDLLMLSNKNFTRNTLQRIDCKTLKEMHEMLAGHAKGRNRMLEEQCQFVSGRHEMPFKPQNIQRRGGIVEENDV